MSVSIESDLSEKGRDIYLSRLIKKKFETNQPVLDKGDSVSGAYFVLEGRLRVYTLSENGREATLYNIAPGETCVLALNSLFNNFLYPAWVIADDNTTVGVLPGNIYRELFKSEEVFQDLTIKALSATVFGLMTELEQRHAQTVKQRVATYLMMRSSSDFIISTTQQKIADDLGSSREFVARILSEFSDMGMIKTSRGKVIILDYPQLSKVTDNS